MLVLRLRKARVLFAFFVIASTWWFQDSLLLMFTPKCFAVLCRRSPRLVALCLAFLCFDLGIYGLRLEIFVIREYSHS